MIGEQINVISVENNCNSKIYKLIKKKCIKVKKKVFEKLQRIMKKYL
jgi:hypothetical protein